MIILAKCFFLLRAYLHTPTPVQQIQRYKYELKQMMLRRYRVALKVNGQWSLRWHHNWSEKVTWLESHHVPSSHHERPTVSPLKSWQPERPLPMCIDHQDRDGLNSLENRNSLAVQRCSELRFRLKTKLAWFSVSASAKSSRVDVFWVTVCQIVKTWCPKYLDNVHNSLETRLFWDSCPNPISSFQWRRGNVVVIS